MTYRLKATAPQELRDIEAEPETIEVVQRERLHVAVAYWREHRFEERLPIGIEGWTPEEAMAVMNNVARRLKVKIAKAKWAVLAQFAESTAEPKETLWKAQPPLPEAGTLQVQELTELIDQSHEESRLPRRRQKKAAAKSLTAREKAKLQLRRSQRQQKSRL